MTSALFSHGLKYDLIPIAFLAHPCHIVLGQSRKNRMGKMQKSAPIKMPRRRTFKVPVSRRLWSRFLLWKIFVWALLGRRDVCWDNIGVEFFAGWYLGYLWDVFIRYISFIFSNIRLQYMYKCYLVLFVKNSIVKNLGFNFIRFVYAQT